LVSLNSDDAAYNRAYIGDNYVLCYREFQLTMDDLRKLSENSFLMAFISDSQRSGYLKKIDDYISLL